MIEPPLTDGLTNTEILRPEYPRPELVREGWWMNLNGRWEFQLDLSRSGRARGLQNNHQLKDSIVVPFAPESRLSGIGFVDFIPALWYRRKIRLPDHWLGRRTLLHIGACDYATTIFLNGREVGSHRGGYTPFTFELTQALAGKDLIDLAIYVEDDIRSGEQAKGKQSHVFHSVGWDYTRTTGIWQTVWLESVPFHYIKRVRITPQLDRRSILVQVQIDGQLRPDGMVVIMRALLDGLAVGEERMTCYCWSPTCELHLSKIAAWTPETPILYDLEVELLANHSTPCDQLRGYFGMRSVAVHGYALELNGKPVFQRLVLDQGFYPEGIYTAPTDADLRHDIQLGQGMGFNGARLHQKVFEPRFLYWCDRLGYLVWGETPDWGLEVNRAGGLADFIGNWLEQMERDHNHPALVGWCPFNEHDSRPNPEAFRTVFRLTKALDPSRPAIDSSGWTHVETEIYDVHDYTQDPAGLKLRYEPISSGQGEVYRNLDIAAANCEYHLGQPYFVSEFGGIWWNPGQTDQSAWGYGASPKSEAEFLTRFRGLIEVLLNNPRICGFCYTQLTDVEQEVNGLYTFARKPKFDPSLIRSVLCQTAAIEEVAQTLVPIFAETEFPAGLREQGPTLHEAMGVE